MILLLLLAIAGLVDSVYLTWEHFNNAIPPCSINRFLPVLSDCGKVLTSSYSTIYHVPVALIGVLYYSTLTIWLLGSILSKNKIYRYLVVLQTIAGALASVGFMYIQLAIIKSICAYCTLSALISFAIVALAYNLFRKERFELHLGVYAFVYQQILKPFYFILSPEFIHQRMIVLGSNLAKTPLMEFAGTKFVYQDKSLRQKLAGINFDNPIGLAAGFDYDADLTQALSYLDFGFQSVGTITNQPYEGNRPPMLGRLIKSRSLMVNKGFKNQGAKNISEKLAGLRFLIPLGVSIGVTNSEKIKTLDEAIKDIVTAFKIFEKSAVKNSYYELNISCPNLALVKTVSFYPPKNLELLLTAIDRLRLKKPAFVKMPIEKTNAESIKILDVIAKHRSVTGIIIGNLSKDRKNPALIPTEVKQFKVGNFSGKACEKRSNELIKLAYKKYGKRFVIVGCGGVFSATDAYEKIRLGASLVQLITGMIFQGPQLISQINLGLIDLLRKDGFNNVKQAVGSAL